MAWNKPSVASAPSPTPKKKPTAWRGAVAGGVVALAAIIAAVVIFSGGDAKPKAKAEKKPAAINEVKGVKTQNVGNVDAKKAESARDFSRLANESAPVVATNDAKTVDISAMLTNKNVTVVRGSVFNSSADQIIAMALSNNGRTPAPPVPLPRKLSEKDFRKALETPIEVLETDSEHTREIKELVIAAREEIKTRMDNGEKFNDILAEHQKNEMENFKVRQDAMTELKEILASGDVEGARKYVDTMNICFQQMGIREIKMPKKSGLGKKAFLERKDKE